MAELLKKEVDEKVKPLDEKEVELQILARALRGMYRTAGSSKPVGFENVPDDFRDRHVEKALEYFDRSRRGA